jgi:hypothetical protein
MRIRARVEFEDGTRPKISHSILRCFSCRYHQILTLKNLGRLIDRCSCVAHFTTTPSDIVNCDCICAKANHPRNLLPHKTISDKLGISIEVLVNVAALPPNCGIFDFAVGVLITLSQLPKALHPEDPETFPLRSNLLPRG